MRIVCLSRFTQELLLALVGQGWEAARDHARSAVGTDNRLRRWLPPGASAGLLYKCLLGNIDLTAPLGASACPHIPLLFPLHPTHASSFGPLALQSALH